MPSVQDAMARSLRSGVIDKLKDSLIRSIAKDLAQRDIISDAQGKVTDVATAFSSWSNCMSVVWCKWPVIAVIVIGSLIILSILWCAIRCLCCGLSCCCSCFRCLRCCGECCGACDPPKGSPHQYLDEPFIPPHHQGYQTQTPMQAPMQTGFASAAPPQYADFDMAKKGGEDALPQMPSWEGASSKKVMLEEEEVEMKDLPKSPVTERQPTIPNTMSGHTSPVPPSPMGRGPPGQMNGLAGYHQPNSSGYFAGQGQPPDPYAPPSQLHAYNNTPPPQRQSVGFGLDEPYDTPTPAIAELSHDAQRQPPAPQMGGYGQPSMGQQSHLGQQDPMHQQGPIELPTPQPNEFGNRGPYGPPQGPPQGPPRGPSRGPPQGPYGPTRGTPSPGPGAGYGMRPRGPGGPGNGIPDGYGMRRPGTADSVSTRGGRGTPGMDPRMRNSPGPRRTPGPRSDQPYGQSPRRSPSGPNDRGYGPPPPGASNSPRGNFNRTYSPAPDRHQLSASPAPVARAMPAQAAAQAPQESPSHSPIVNNSGFDFTSGFARPQELDSRPSESHEPVDETYPGYKPYTPA